MPLIPEPWARIRVPVPIPQPLLRNDLLALTNQQFAELLRSNLIPGEGRPQRAAWDSLWSLLGRDEELLERTYDTLEDLLDTTAAARSAGDLDDAQVKRATKFADQCQKAWNRLDERPRRRDPLAWTPAAEGLSLRSRRIIATLVGAIAQHRSQVLHDTAGQPSAVDTDLWNTLRALNLDPRDHRTPE